MLRLPGSIKYRPFVATVRLRQTKNQDWALGAIEKDEDGQIKRFAVCVVRQGVKKTVRLKGLIRIGRIFREGNSSKSTLHLDLLLDPNNVEVLNPTASVA